MGPIIEFLETPEGSDGGVPISLSGNKSIVWRVAESRGVRGISCPPDQSMRF